MTNVGFIGLGGMGALQIKSFADLAGCRIDAGADPSPAARQQFASDHPDARVYEDYRQLLADDGIEAVVVAVPTGLHLEVGLAAVEANRPLLMEKPMARTVADCRTLIEAADKRGTLLMVAQCRRFDPSWGAWGKLVRDGKLGSPLLWRHVMAGPGPGRWFMDDQMGGGPLLDGAIHNYDFANFLWGDPEMVTARAVKLNPDVTAMDTATAVIGYPGGNQLMVSWCWARKGHHLFDVLGAGGSLMEGPGSIEVSEEDRKQYSLYCVTDQAGEPTLFKAPRDGIEKYVKQAEHFLTCVAGETACHSPGSEAIKGVAVAQAIFESAAANGQPVRVSW